jgi:hypothetical protein
VRILWVATKAPRPARDGGRLLLARTVEALAAAGHEVHLVAPADTTAAPADTGSGPGAAMPRAGVVEHLVAAPPRPSPPR